MADQHEEQFETMPRPPAVSPGAAALAAQARHEEKEAWQTNVLSRLGARAFARASELYVARHRDGTTEIGRARRILTRRTARTEQHLWDDGNVAHIVTLTPNPLVEGRYAYHAWCGDKLKAGQRWSRLRAFSTCASCRAWAGGRGIDDDERGWLHRLAETNPYQARIHTSPKLQQELTNAFLKTQEEDRVVREQRKLERAELARRAARLDRRIVRGVRALGQALSFR